MNRTGLTCVVVFTFPPPRNTGWIYYGLGGDKLSREVGSCIDNSMNAKEYSKVLQDCLVPFYESHDTPPEFQHDNAPYHAPKYTSE